MKQEIEQAVDQMTEEEPDPDQIDLGVPPAPPGVIVGADEGDANATQDLLSQLEKFGVANVQRGTVQVEIEGVPDSFDYIAFTLAGQELPGTDVIETAARLRVMKKYVTPWEE